MRYLEDLKGQTTKCTKQYRKKATKEHFSFHPSCWAVVGLFTPLVGLGCLGEREIAFLLGATSKEKYQLSVKKLF